MHLTENARRHIGETVTIRWGTSRGRDSYGYTTCSLRNHRGERVAACNGGGYDMRGTVLGNWIAYTFRKELLKLKPEVMPTNSHWEYSHTVVCDGECRQKWNDDLITGEKPATLPEYPDGTEICPVCGAATRRSNSGRTVDDGRYFYGLTFHNPNYDPGKAVIGRDCTDRTLGESKGETVEQAEKAGKSLGLERYQAIYAASSKHPTKRHTIPSIDGACGVSSVLEILRAIGLDLRQVVNTSKLDVYEIVRARARV